MESAHLQFAFVLQHVAGLQSASSMSVLVSAGVVLCSLLPFWSSFVEIVRKVTTQIQEILATILVQTEPWYWAAVALAMLGCNYVAQSQSERDKADTAEWRGYLVCATFGHIWGSLWA